MMKISGILNVLLAVAVGVLAVNLYNRESAENEGEQTAIENIMKDKTSLVVAHRLSTIVNADRILVIQKGQIVEDGTHETLMALKGYYYRLYTNQFNEEQNSKLMGGYDYGL